ncbi:hypothetical protein OG562_27365 [Streptomyces sp. NBC_01275]|uniref:hypothetical protein n=1 Tax=Streptomyces sp. NBC_01275 TaxID=2903807 RepID=UPI00224FD288|nr:hypothetical protein [Streptomyces sp. NBC_01275]MCX4764619.1 hypothetical protein [Streptomyces sp. NBC_01275]
MRAAAVMTGLLLMGSATPALAGEIDAQPLAADSTAVAGVQSDEVLDEDLPIPGEVDGPTFQEPQYSADSHCSVTGPFVHITKNVKNTMSVKYSTYVTNNKSYAIDYNFSSQKSGTTTIGASVTISAEYKVLWLGKIKADINASASKSWTSSLNVGTSGQVKAHSTVTGDYGIMKENIQGYTATLNGDCSVTNKKNMTVWAPYREGWEVN